jgi:predicted AAA+ superfamily ATPase
MTVRIPRHLDNLLDLRKDGRVLVIYGPRRVGKTSLVAHVLDAEAEKESVPPGMRILRATGDDIDTRLLISGQSQREILAWAKGYDTIFLDEAQKIPDVGNGLKLLIDARPQLLLIATGSASFELAGQLGEPLTGRQTPLAMFPIAIGEMQGIKNDFEIQKEFDDYLRFGMYPEVRTADTENEKRDILNELVSSYLYRDILELDRVKSSRTLKNLLTLIALQEGGEVSLNELAASLHIDVKTVDRYLDLFEKSYILYSLQGFSRNLRKEVSKSRKYYFYDTGVRNAIINNFNPLKMRNDVGPLWENFVIMERIKALSYAKKAGSFYFWRTYDRKEIDLIEDRDGSLHGYEIKYGEASARKAQVPKDFALAYPDASFEVISPATLLESLAQIPKDSAS